MPVTLAQLTQNRATVTVPVDAEMSVTVEYYPGRITEKVFAQMQGFASMGETDILAQFAAFNATFAHLVASWDVTDEDGTMFPLEAARLAEIPIGFRVQVLSSILGSISPEAMAPQVQMQATNGLH